MDALKAYVSESEDSDSADLEGEVTEAVGQVESENLDFFGIHPEGAKSANVEGEVTKALDKESCRTEDSDRNEKVEKESSDTKSSKHDFLGIFSEEKFKTRKSDLTERLKRETVLTKSVNIDAEQVTVEVPNSSFWNDISDSDIQIHQHTTGFSGKNVEDSQKLFKKHVNRQDLIVGQKRTLDNYGDQKLMKRTKVPVEYGASFNKDEQQSKGCGSFEKRKIYFVHPKITPLLHCKRVNCRIPTVKEWDNPGHAGAVNRLKWNIPNYSHLLVTCSMDTTIKIWNIWSQLDPCVQMLRVHSKAVRDVAWSQDGKHLLSSSYDKSAAVTDVERGTTLSRLEHKSFVMCCKYHPVNHHICVTGVNNQLQVWDTRTPSMPSRTLTYKDNIGQVQDIVLTGDGSTLFTCSDLVSRDSADRNLMAWDFQSGIVLSNQMYQERFTVSRLQIHPTENQLLAQSNGNYIALFSFQRPYKMSKHKRFEGHKLQGYNIGFDISPDGQTVYSGSADGKLYCYNYQSGKHLRSVSTGLQVVMDIANHPLLASTVALSSWDGTVQVWK